jgi:hypothetical protein
MLLVLPQQSLLLPCLQRVLLQPAPAGSAAAALLCSGSISH